MFKITPDGSKFRLDIWSESLQQWTRQGFYKTEVQAEAVAAKILQPEAA